MQSGTLSTDKTKTGREQRWGFSQKAGGTVDVSSAAPHYNLLTLNSFSTPPTFHIFLVIRQQSMLLCVVWAHCFSSLTASILLFSRIEKLLLFLPSKINMGLDSLLPPGEHKRNNSWSGRSAQNVHTLSSCERHYNSLFTKVK